MSFKILVDMNLSPDWVEVLSRHGWTVVHWSSQGDPKAPDKAIMAWAKANQFVIFTHDLDFGAMLALTEAEGPSVIQIRAQDVMPNKMEKQIVETIKRYEVQLTKGVLIVVDQAAERTRILPLIR